MVLHRIWRLSHGLENTMFAAETEWGGEQWNCCLKCCDKVNIFFFH